MATLSERKAKRMQVDFTNPYPPFPREVFFDLNNTCNCRCYFCGNHKMSIKASMDKELGFRLLKDFYDNGSRELALYATGEPFLRSDLSEFVSKAKMIGYEYIFISSNGTLATPEKAKPALDAGLDSIKFSVNAGTRESYLKVHGLDLFETVIENIKWFYEYRKESGLNYRIYISMVPTKATKVEWPILQNILKGYVDEMDFRGCSNQGANMLENNLTETIDAKNILGSLSKNQYTGRCPDLFFRCTVTPQGYLSACVVDYQNYLIVADLNKVPVRDAWHSEQYVALRKRHISGKLKGLICYNCINNCETECAPLNPDYATPFKVNPGKARIDDEK